MKIVLIFAGLLVVFGLGYWVGTETVPPVVATAENSLSPGTPLKKSEEIAVAPMPSQVPVQRPSADLVPTNLPADHALSLEPSSENISDAKAEAQELAEVRRFEERRTEIQARLKSATGDLQAEGFLQSVRRRNLRAAIQSSVPLRPQDDGAEAINGSFTGPVTMANDPENAWTLQFEANSRFAGQTLKGRASVGLLRGQEVISRINQNGELTLFRRAGNDISVLLELSDRYYVEMFHIPAVDAFIGNFYKKTGPGKYGFQGVVRLNRVK